MNKSVLAVCLFTGLMFWSCSKDDGGPPAKTPDQLLADGWKAFAGHNYQLALTDFNSAIQGNSKLSDAFNGAGWANAKLNLLAAAVTQLRVGLTKDAANRQMIAGLSFVFNAQKLYDSSITRAAQVLGVDSNWVFTRDTSINSADLHVLLAEDYFALTPPDFAASLTEVQKLNPLFSAAVLTIDGQTALAIEIERLGTVY